MAAIPPSERYKSLRTEYQVAMRYAIHATEINWQLGSILIGGSLAAVALALTTKLQIPVILITLGAIVAILAWFFFLRRNHQFAAIAIDRMIRIEQELGLVWGLQASVRFGVPQKDTPNPRLAKPTGYGTSIFLAVGLVVVLLALIIYIILFGL